MGLCFSLPRRLLPSFSRQKKSLQLQGETLSNERPHTPQRSTSPSNSSQTETKVTYPSHPEFQHSLNPANDKQTAAPGNDAPTVPAKLTERAHSDDKGEQTTVVHPGPSHSPCPTLPVPLTSSVPLFALIIGIDNYTNCPQLRGAVADARAVKNYLVEMLGVSQDHICMLLDHHATRQGIIKAFEEVRHDERIQNGDPILIFYAGHGGELSAPSSWGFEGKIQCLLPHDYNATNHNATATLPIPDRTIGALIEGIARAKGDNISVVFDCCYSAGCARYENQAYIPRTVDLRLDIPEDLDINIWGSRAGAIPDSFAYHGLYSHVLLAACREDEIAYEHEGHGLFTVALLNTLDAGAINDFTYTEIIGRIRLPMQHPQCQGLNRHRVLFNARVLGLRRARHTVHTEDDGKFVVSAGLAHGVLRGVEFTMYNEVQPRLGAVIVDDAAEIGDFETILFIPEMHLTTALYAKLTRVGNLPLHIAQGAESSPILNETLQRTVGSATANFWIVEEAKEGKLQVAMEKDRVVFKILDEQTRKYGLTELPHTPPLDAVDRILAAAAHYYWYLDLKNKNDHGINHKVSVDFYPLRRSFDDYGLPFLVPIAPGFCLRDPTSGDLVIDFVVDSGTLYGIEVKNDTPHDLYFNAFLFNDSSFSIVPYYTQPSAGNPDAPLKRNGTFAIGYGSEGLPPFAYWLSEHQDVDVGHLKIFFSTRPVDLSDITQSSPFNHMNTRSHIDDEARKARLSMSPHSMRSQSSLVHIWFTINIPIVQRRSTVM